MNKKLKILIFLWLAFLGTIFPAKISHTQTEETIIRRELIFVGVRGDSPWFGYRNDGKWTGYCIDIAYALAERLSANQLDPIRVRLVTSTTQSRWDMVTSGQVDLECGPNTISAEREEKYGVSFSTPFFITATQILVKKETQEQDLKDGKGVVGVVRNTTNENDIKTSYPDERIDNKYLSREQGVKALLDGEINGFASDGTLLLGSLFILNSELGEDYNLLTPQQNGRPFCAGYGFILPGGEENSSWKRYVNDFLANDKKARRVRQKWLGDLSENSQRIYDACTQES
ncbi:MULTISPECIES: amino acid ABC transporter substrate-binding protein [Okeania]|uniref:ABC transporter substrate-binding protein n=1 Tax=Okeania hirsuta TaxID=1458930 RepID=A0A3N6QDT0_9CYAN|nr:MULTISPECIES: amino acid ABC transporter substrate-binding protein [Okeania]NES75633.1 transporter substrate-binding domain-containing protein [Okeania sp. SIO1H4]NES88652.1 transporter substrate-binding domain-containing protein [Okeania sp. SIO2B9]NET19022.1 transporter substrate-binding domain-containing protein [Okeania sp. SIO1H5]NET75361.1 transporter substrate-binding domain-containing protein [Okeania sp. SIO1F9]NET91904.1 transporter substrate-binding domain-containing protein [Oke